MLKDQLANDPFWLGWSLRAVEMSSKWIWPDYDLSPELETQIWLWLSFPQKNEEHHFIYRKDALSNFYTSYQSYLQLPTLAQTSNKHQQIYSLVLQMHC